MQDSASAGSIGDTGATVGMVAFATGSAVAVVVGAGVDVGSGVTVGDDVGDGVDVEAGPSATNVLPTPAVAVESLGSIRSGSRSRPFSVG